MATRRQELQAHKFMVRRLTAGLVGGDAGTAQPPAARLKAGLFLGTAAGVLGIGGAAVVGLISPKADSSWQDGQSVVVEQGTYNQYIYTGGVLHQVLNQASAMLALPKYAVRTVPASALKDVPRGTPVGIIGAPADVPNPSALTGGPWTVCSSAGPGGKAQVSATLGVEVAGADVADGQAVYVGVDNGGANDTRYLVWGGKRHLLKAPLPLMTAFQMTAAQPTIVGAAWLNAVPAGSDIAPLSVGARTASGTLGTVGDLYTYQDASGSYEYVVTAQGLTPVTPTQAALLRAGGSPAPKPLDPNRLVAAKEQNQVTAALPGDLPAALPTLAVGSGLTGATSGAGAVCVEETPGTDAAATPAYRIRSVTTAAVDAAGAWSATDGTNGHADRVLVRPGDGALATSTAGGVAQLLTAAGTRFPVAAKDDLGRLGYASAAPTAVPATILDLFPEGPALDAADASTPRPATVSAP
ncbi:type VII secretion protein EccB [Catenulispora sp. EB89]|uniref:type VII secretion protein EccB n=1 Tax=Catenulispora sp. EB89 TaxID=3156257 RepID=UPI0035197A23